MNKTTILNAFGFACVMTGVYSSQIATVEKIIEKTPQMSAGLAPTLPTIIKMRDHKERQANKFYARLLEYVVDE